MKRQGPRLLLLPLLTVWLYAPLAARADQPLWELGLGAGLLHLPHYRGSDQYRNWLLPVPYVNYRGEIFRADREGAHAVLAEGSGFDFDISLAANTPARSGDNRARVGMPNLAPTVEVGPNVKWTFARGSNWALDLRLPARLVLTVDRHPHDIGFTFSPVLNLDTTLADWNVGLQSGPVAGSRRYHAYFYEVAPVYATAARPAYAARAGAAGWATTASASRRFGNWWVGSYMQSDSLRGATFDTSPLVKSHSNFAFGFGLSYVFKVSEARVPGPR